ncbi:MAG: ATP-dependent helicase [Bacteroidales bacterium]|nr:ATP-dependent helicase [Bacteroidales bacterium]
MFKAEDVVSYIAGAGCGKTTTLLNDLKEMLNIYQPHEIAFVSFSRKAILEMLQRLEKFGVPYDPDEFPYFRTLHSLCYHLNQNNKKIISREDIKIFTKATNWAFDIHNLADCKRGFENEGQLFFDLFALERALGKELDYRLIFPRKSYEDFKFLYTEFKKRLNLTDYHDCLDDYLATGKPIPSIKVAFIDEAQDLSPQQWRVCFKAFENAKHIRIAGDDWQTIFGFQGASPEMFIQVAKSGVIKKLETSYRLPVNVANLAEKIVAKLVNKIDKRCLTNKTENGLIDSIGDIENLIPKLNYESNESWYILFRLNYHVKVVGNLLKYHLVLFHYSDSFCLPEKYLKLIKTFYKFKSELLSPEGLEFCKKYEIFPREDGGWPEWWESKLVPDDDLRELIKRYETKYGFKTLWEASINKPKILVTTIFKVKGGEADNVAVCLATNRRIEEWAYVDRDNEVRIYYTAVTRAKKNLFFVKINEQNESLFLKEVL